MNARPGSAHHLQPTKRGWLFLGNQGGPCDKACKMCYYAFQKKLTFYSLDTLKHHANLFRHHYGLEYCDLSGGEVTIYGPKDERGRRPELEDLVRHCWGIGLRPTIITHGQNNTEALVKGLEDAGLEDWLISLHGMQTGHERTVVDHRGEGAGGWQRVVDGFQFIQRPVRYNFTAQNFNYRELPELARWLTENRTASVWNIIQFNPFFAWHERPEIDFQVKSSELAPFIGEAVQTAEAAGWEVNVRYFPYCIADEHGFARNCVNFYGTQYDHWEWCLAATNRTPLSVIAEAGGLEAVRRLHCDSISQSRDNAKCAACRFRPICDGPSTQYRDRYGVDELRPVTGAPVTDVYWFEKGGTFA